MEPGMKQAVIFLKKHCRENCTCGPLVASITKGDSKRVQIFSLSVGVVSSTTVHVAHCLADILRALGN
jgi:hypothetical protein